MGEHRIIRRSRLCDPKVLRLLQKKRRKTRRKKKRVAVGALAADYLMRASIIPVVFHRAG